MGSSLLSSENTGLGPSLARVCRFMFPLFSPDVTCDVAADDQQKTQRASGSWNLDAWRTHPSQRGGPGCGFWVASLHGGARLISKWSAFDLRFEKKST